MLKKNDLRLWVTGAVMVASNMTLAAGFQIQEQNSAGLGTAYAGVGSIAEDASTAFYNAAGLTRLKEEQVVFSAVGIFPNSKLSPSLATNNTGVAIGTHSTKARGDAMVPGFYYAKRLSSCVVFGFAATSPFGLKTKYGHHSSVRYMATRSELRTVDLAPSLAFGVGNGFSVAGGVDFLHAEAHLNSRIGRTVPTLGGPITLTDGFQENTADNWGVGWHVAMLYELCESTRFGINYRSKVTIKPKGHSISRSPFSPIGALSPEIRQKVRATVTLPETASLSAYHEFCNEWAMVADVQWTHWERFKKLTLNYASLAPLHLADHALSTPERYKDTYRLALGAIRTLDDCWKLRMGAAYDRSPTRNEYRTARIPDSNRVWIGLGAQYRINECMAIDAGYGHLFFKKSHLDERAPLLSSGLPSSAARLKSKRKTNANLFGLQFTWDIA